MEETMKDYEKELEASFRTIQDHRQNECPRQPRKKDRAAKPTDWNCESSYICHVPSVRPLSKILEQKNVSYCECYDTSHNL